MTVRATVGSDTADPSLAATIGSRHGIAIPRNEIFGNNQTQLNYIFDRFRAMGIRELRTDMIWMDVQTTNAAPNRAAWPGSEYVMVANTAAAYGLDLIFAVHMTPAWARLSGAACNGPSTPAAYAAFCANVAAQFTSGNRTLTAIEVWNEPNLSGPNTFWQYGRPASELAAMQIAAHAAVKALPGAAGQVKVGMGGLSAVPVTGGDATFRYTAATEWLTALYAVPGWAAANDFLAVHPYTYPFPWADGVANNDGFEVLTQLRAIAVAQNEGAKPWWLTEYGAPTNAAGAAVTEVQQRRMFLDLFDWTANPANAWVTKFHWYSYYDRAAPTSTDPEDGFGIFLNDELAEKLVPAAMRSVRTGTPVYDPDAVALFARFDVEPTAARKALINDRIIAGKATTWWSKLDALWIHAAHDAEAGRLNWLGPRFNCLPVNNPTFTTDRGYASDGVSSYLDTQFNPAVEAPLGSKYQRDSASFGIRSNTNDSGSASLAGHWDGTKGTTILPRSGDRAGFRVNASTYTQTSAGGATTGLGMFVATRTAATVSRFFRDGTMVASASAASASPANLPLMLGGITTASLRPAQFSMGFIGGGLSDAEIAGIRDWFEPYRIAMGVV